MSHVISTEMCGSTPDGKRYAVEASTAGLPVGSWPKKVTLEGVGEFNRCRAETRDGDLLFVEYRDSNGRVLSILND